MAKKKKKKKISMIKVVKKLKLSKPKVSIRKLNAVQTIMKGRDKPRLVREGKTGWFRKEYENEKIRWLGG